MADGGSAMPELFASPHGRIPAALKSDRATPFGATAGVSRDPRFLINKQKKASND
jgi:hypothetical protein